MRTGLLIRLASYLAVAVGFVTIFLLVRFDVLPPATVNVIFTGGLAALAALLTIVALLYWARLPTHHRSPGAERGKAMAWLRWRFVLLDGGLVAVYGLILVDFLGSEPASASPLSLTFIVALTAVVVIVLLLTSSFVRRSASE